VELQFKNESYYFPDLSPYRFGDAPPFERVLRIGWLEAGHDYQRGAVDDEVMAKLTEIKASRWPTLFHFGLIRGSYSCTLCPKGDRAGCSTELLIQNAEKPGSYFGCLSMIDHFIRDHNYKPPEVFLSSVMKVDLNRPFDAVLSYDEAHLSVDAMRDVYEIHVRRVAGSTAPENRRYRQWLEEHGFWPPREKQS